VNAHKTTLVALYTIAILFALGVILKGYGYYSLPVTTRPHSILHQTLKPGGLWGHGLGILGSSMILLLFLYSARKRNKFGLRHGKIKNWLDIHIFFGIMGPVFINLHTSFKFGGIVAVSYFSMMAVMLSGFLGRYLYVQIPRKLSGEELSLNEMKETSRKLTNVLVEKYHLDKNILAQITHISGTVNANQSGFAAILAILKNDLTRFFKIRNLQTEIHRKYPKLPPKALHQVISIISQQSLLLRRIAFLKVVQPMLHYWHVIHKPFAYVMVIIMFIHIGVAILFGYSWIFRP
jgi:hypothetical protein